MFDDRIFAPNTRGSLHIYIFDGDATKLAGYAVFIANENDLICDCVVIYEAYQRMGLATICYDFAEDFFEISLTPSGLITEEGELFWANRSSRAQSTPLQQDL
jgi:hypothetical protein